MSASKDLIDNFFHVESIIGIQYRTNEDCF